MTVIKSHRGPVERQPRQVTLISFLDTSQPVEFGIAVPAGPGMATVQLSDGDLHGSQEQDSRLVK